MKLFVRTLLTAGLLALTGAAQAELTIGVSLSLTGPASGLGIPIANQVKLWPASIAGEKLKVIMLDDASDPSKGVQNAKRFLDEDQVDLVFGSASTPVASAMAATIAEAKTVQLAPSPPVLQAGKDHWMFRLAHSPAVMAQTLIEHMKKRGIKTLGFLGYSDAYGESWLQDFTAQSEALGGPKVVAVERFARSDTAVTGQSLKLVAANPQAILVVASGSGAAMPHKALVDRGYKGTIYQSHGAATYDLMRLGGKDVEGAYVVSSPVVTPEQLPQSHPSKKLALDFVQKYEKAYGAGSRNQFSPHAYDAVIVLEKAVPIALKKGKTGSPEFRSALRDALESMGPTVVSQGVLTYTKDNHWGHTAETGVMLKVVGGQWKLDN